MRPIVFCLLAFQSNDDEIKKLVEFRKYVLESDEKELIARIPPIEAPSSGEVAKLKTELTKLEATQKKLDDARKKNPNTMTSKKREDERKAAIVDHKERIEELEERAKSEREADGQRRADAIQKVRDAMAAKRRDLGFMPAPPLDMEHLKAGQIGIIAGPIPGHGGGSPFEAKTVQDVISQFNNLGQFPERYWPFVKQHGGKDAFKPGNNIRIIQIIDDSTLIAAQNTILDRGTKTFFLRGIDTKGLTDDDEYFSAPSVMEVTGTRRYESVGAGVRTKFVLEPLDLEKVRPFIKSQWTNRLAPE